MFLDTLFSFKRNDFEKVKPHFVVGRVNNMFFHLFFFKFKFVKKRSDSIINTGRNFHFNITILDKYEALRTI